MIKGTLVMLTIVLLSCSHNGELSEPKDKPVNNSQNDEIETITVKNKQGNVVLEAHASGNKLEGNCIWYSSQGDVVAKGVFKNGKPWEGTFIDWTRFVSDSTAAPYDRDFYCRDWVSHFEMSFLSNRVDYAPLIVRYKDGQGVEAY